MNMRLNKTKKNVSAPCSPGAWVRTEKIWACDSVFFAWAMCERKTRENQCELCRWMDHCSSWVLGTEFLFIGVDEKAQKIFFFVCLLKLVLLHNWCNCQIGKKFSWSYIYLKFWFWDLLCNWNYFVVTKMKEIKLLMWFISLRLFNPVLLDFLFFWFFWWTSW